MRKPSTRPNPKQRTWSRQAVECYYLGGICKKCSLPEQYKANCQMKSSVLELIKYSVVMPDNLKRERQDILEDEYTKEYYKELKINENQS